MQAALAQLSDRLKALPSQASARAKADVKVLFMQRRDLLQRAEKAELFMDEQNQWGMGLDNLKPKDKTE